MSSDDEKNQMEMEEAAIGNKMLNNKQKYSKLASIPRSARTYIATQFFCVHTKDRRIGNATKLQYVRYAAGPLDK